MPLLDTLARRLIRRGLRRGLIEGNLLWLGIGAAAALVHLLFKEQRPRVIREELRLGETITVTHVAPAPTGRRSRRGAESESL